MLEYSDLSERLGLYDPNNNAASKTDQDKYTLRPRSGRRSRTILLDDEPPSRQSKSKQKPAPLSKYRRKTANARERSRMREINQAFEALRKAVPQVSVTHQQVNEKLTKITTLRLAMKYISALSAALSDEPQQDLLSDCSELDCFLLESDGESLPISDHSITPADFTIPDEFAPDPDDQFSHFDPFLAGLS